MKLVLSLLILVSLPAQAEELTLHAIWGKCLCNSGGPCLCDPETCDCPGCVLHADPLTKPKRAVLYFTADWCNPCQVWKRTEFPKLVEARISVGRTDYEQFREFDLKDYPDLTRQWRVTSWPTFIFLDEIDGDSYRIVKRVSGPVSAAEIQRFLN